MSSKKSKPATTTTNEEVETAEAESLLEAADAVAEESESPTRLFSGQSSLDHDLYKLELSNLQQNKAVQGEAPEILEIEHVHHFHSVDSSGRKQTRCTAIGGHFHEMTLVRAAKGAKPAVYTCGPAMRETRVKFRGKLQKKTIPAMVYQDKNEKGEPIPGGEKIVDTHRHPVMYLRSSKINKRTTNIEAVNLEARNANLTAPIAGVTG